MDFDGNVESIADKPERYPMPLKEIVLQGLLTALKGKLMFLPCMIF
jgi:hypothetical protein